MKNDLKYVANVEPVTFKILGDERGHLIVLENGHNVPFDVRRVFYIYGTEVGVVRGKHAHKKSKQLLVCVAGCCDIYCEWQGRKETYRLDAPDKGLLVEGMVWHNMLNFSPGCVLMVMADNYYDENDYIRNYEDFLKEENQ